MWLFEIAEFVGLYSCKFRILRIFDYKESWIRFVIDRTVVRVSQYVCRLEYCILLMCSYNQLHILTLFSRIINLFGFRGNA